MTPLSEIPDDRHKIWFLTTVLLERWFGRQEHEQKITPERLDRAGDRLQIAIPEAAREWYVRFAGRLDVWCRRRELLMPEAWRTDGAHFIFQTAENNTWGIALRDLGKEDPPVLLLNGDLPQGKVLENERFSEFVFQLLLSALKYNPEVPHRAEGRLSEEEIQTLERQWSRLPFPDWHHDEAPVRFYGDDRVLLERNGSRLYVLAWSEEDRQRVAQVFPDLAPIAGQA